MDNRYNILSIAFILVCCAGCANQHKDVYDDEQKLAEAIDDLWAKQKYRETILLTRQLTENFAYSNRLANALLIEADCYVKMNDVMQAIDSYKMFIRLYPTHEKVPYALYSIATLFFSKIPTADRDQTVTRAAIEYLQVLLNDYKDYEHYEEAKKLLRLCNGQCAACELHWAKYYQKHKNYGAAISRLAIIVERYLDTDFAPESLYRLVECFIAIGGNDDVIAVALKLNELYPDSEWMREAEALYRKYNIKLPCKNNAITRKDDDRNGSSGSISNEYCVQQGKRSTVGASVQNGANVSGVQDKVLGRMASNATSDNITQR